MTDRTLCPVVIPVIGHSFVFQHVGIICKLGAPVHKKSHKLREGKFEHILDYRLNRALLEMQYIHERNNPKENERPGLTVEEDEKKDDDDVETIEL